MRQVPVSVKFKIYTNKGKINVMMAHPRTMMHFSKAILKRVILIRAFSKAMLKRLIKNK